MITVMRQYMKTLHLFLWSVVAIFIATSIFVWGRSGTGGAAEGVAVVNGETIPRELYERAYKSYVMRLTQAYPDRFTREMAERLGLEQQVLSDLVRTAVVVQRARTEGFSVSDEELNLQIQATPAFQVNGVFSMDAYHEALRRGGMTPAGFEEDVRRDLAWRKVETTVKAGAQVSDAEVEQAFAYRKEQVRAAWALVDVPALMKSTAASDAEIEAFLKDSPAQFKRPARRRVQYVLADAKEWVAGIPDSEVEQYYREHAAEFELPRQVNAAHVLVGVAQTGGSEAETAARGKAQDAIRRAKAGEDFGKLAKELSEDPRTAAQGGELGWIVKGQLVPPFEEAAFVLKKGEITSSPVRTQFGFHVIKVLDVKEGGRKPLKEVTPQIRAKIVTERIDKAATTKAQEVRPVLAAAKDFAAEAKRLGLESRESMIAKASGARGADRGEALQEAAFGLAIGGVSQPVKTPAGVVILKVMEQIPAGVPPLADIKDEVANAVKRKKAEAAAFERARKLAADARTGDLVPLAKREGLQGGETPRFSRLKPAERIPREVLVAALQTPAGALGEPVKTPQGYYVVKTLERVPADPADLGKEREQIARELLETKRNEAWESWVAAAREKAKIEVSGRLTSPL